MADVPVVKSVTQKGEKAAMIHFTIGEAAWSPDFETAVKLVGKPLPADWRLEKGEYGPKALPPKKGGSGGAPAWRNTKEGFLAEQQGRQRWQEFEEERKDRRTALMTAAEHYRERETPGRETILDLADTFYGWLRSSPAAGPPSGVATKGEDGDHGKPASASSPAGGTSSGEAQGVRRVESPRPAATSEREASPGTPSVVGEAAGVEPGEGQSKPSPGFPIDAAKCTHKFPSGRWVTWAGGDGGAWLCPKCGTPKLVAMEGTNADLGPA